MSNLLTLIKVNLRETLDKRKFRQNKKQQKFFAYIILMAILFILISTLYSFIYANMYKAADAIDRLFNLSLVFFGAASMMVFTSTVSKMQSIFIGNDYDILCSLPITKKDIVLSKIINLYITEVIVCLILIVPNSIVNTIATSDLRYLTLLPLAFIAPAFPMMASLLFASIMELLIKNQKVKTIISTVIMIVFLVLLFGFSFYTSFSASNNSTVPFDMLGSTFKYLNPTLMFLNMAFEDNLLFVLAFVGVNFLLLFIVLSIVVLLFNKIHNNMVVMKMASQKNGKSKNTNLQIRDQNKELMFITKRRFFKSKNSVMQCGMGLFISLFFTIAICVISATGLGVSYNEETGELFDFFGMLAPYSVAIPIGLCMFMGIMPPSATAVSLEGENFFTLKSLPIDFKAFLKTKLKFSVIIMGVPSLISGILLAIFLPISIPARVVCVVFPPLYCYFVSVFSLIINSNYPYLHWKEEIEVYKYHKSTIITVFSDMGIAIGTVVPAIILVIINEILACAVILGVYLILCIILTSVLINKTAKKLEKLEIGD